MARTNISMCATGIAELINDVESLILTVNAPDNAFVMRITPFTLADGAIDIHIDDDQQLCRAVQFDPRVCLTFEDFPTYQALRGAMVHGVARLTELAESSAVLQIPLDSDDIASFDFSQLVDRARLIHLHHPPLGRKQ